MRKLSCAVCGDTVVQPDRGETVVSGETVREHLDDHGHNARIEAHEQLMFHNEDARERAVELLKEDGHSARKLDDWPLASEQDDVYRTGSTDLYPHSVAGTYVPREYAENAGLTEEVEA